jgi:hypothetical protein
VHGLRGTVAILKAQNEERAPGVDRVRQTIGDEDDDLSEEETLLDTVERAIDDLGERGPLEG